MPLSPKVSCLVISYNQEGVIGETLDSLLGQTYENIEIVISDDASTDRTQEIIESYQKIYPEKIKLIKGKQNIGITPNSKRALDNCSGDFIALIGGDDIWLPNKVETQIAWFRSNPEYIVGYHDVWAFDSQTSQKLYRFSDHHYPQEGSIEDVLFGGCFAGACSVMFRVVSKANLEFDTHIAFSSYWYAVLDYLAKTKEKIGYMEGIYAFYRRNNGNVTQTHNLSDDLYQCYEHLQESYPELKAHIQIAQKYMKAGDVSQAIRKGRFKDALGMIKQWDLFTLGNTKIVLIKLRFFALRKLYNLKAYFASPWGDGLIPKPNPKI
jgi:glycosyltransferase involved in cell wall biosynthesis